MNLNNSFTKRFKSSFKNKIRITVGLIVTMLITGNVAMAISSVNDNRDIVTGDGSIIETNSGIVIGDNIININNGIVVKNGIVTMGEAAYTGSGNSLPDHDRNYKNVNVNDKNTTFIAKTLNPFTGDSGDKTLVVGSKHDTYTCFHSYTDTNILENTGGLSEGEVFVGLKLENGGYLHGQGTRFNVASLTGADVIGIYYTENKSDYGSVDVNVYTEGHGIGFYFSQGGTFNNSGNISADTAVIMTSDTGNNTLTNSNSDNNINGDVLMKSGGTNTVTVSGGKINGDIKFFGEGYNYLTYTGVNVDGTGDIYGDKSGYNMLYAYKTSEMLIEKNIYDFNELKISTGSTATLAEGYEIIMNPYDGYTPYRGTATGLTIDGTLTLNTEISGSDILVPKIETFGGDITVSDTGKVQFYVSGLDTAAESSYEVIFGGDLITTNVVSDGNLVAEDGTLEYDDELFVETLGWSVTDIDESGTQTVVTLSGKDVYDELRATTEDNDETQIINILDDDQDSLGIHEALSNVSMDDAEKAVSELGGEMYGNLVDEHIQVNKMFTGKINSMMSSPLTLKGKRQSDFALLLDSATAELSSDTFTQSPNYSFLQGEEKYIQHFDVLGTTGRFDQTGVEYDTHGSGFVGITEKIIGENSSMGMSYGYFDMRNDYDDGSDAETETFHLGMTHKLYFGKDYMLASHLGAEYSKNDVTREITTLGLEANSDYDSYSVSIGTDLNKNIELSERVTMVPSIGVGYSRIERESFTESGSIGLAALDVEKQGLDSVTSKLGLRLDVDLTDKLVWCLGGSWEHEYADLNKDQKASFKGDANAESFKIQGANIDEDTYSILTGFNYNVNDSLTYRIMYSYTQQDDLGENNIDLGVSWKF
ncbi:autotransporter outer membrane beta-barrel domain-containing protein [Ilyobacter polytropus]|uniref:Outer membrane autotransporter barrel domain protein n=1 Tax=Ilyobacter polytropus (strain ATCC 51220 / DSM 2926 / LMG 16218 / CuHBu1) TaxID=572544 RepID=E3HBX2_ILYPC|nr:autotransporter outer membrane beta-barrel domain-containing protein [Ilyobacter polytropus]ADO84298.1 outer membrane autotransporter barrel domain protein [Ilyobacter polytropus DSM 2926]